ncbi:MAG: biotin--[acetyl-CoA-carboxylase] ligase [Planctomycetota bacterium]|nr:biotin--[acetyl-CoA-carboxylase] ligase [Planctomycetota bacterium]
MTERDCWEEQLECEGRVLVFEEATSTQDAAIAGGLKGGDVCTAIRQTAGRGRRGNAWDATGGVALTVVLDELSPILPIAVGASLAASLNNALPRVQVGIKWPNDIIVDERKLAGILIEEREGRCLVGIGLNVLEPPVTDQKTICLIECGFKEGRLEATQLVINSVFTAVSLNERKAIETWKKRDTLIGTTQTIASKGETHTGLVIDIVPGNHLLLQTKNEIVTLEADQSTVCSP